MFDVETTKTLRKTRKKNLGSFLAMLFCTLIIVSTMGVSFGIRNSYAQQQQQQQMQQPSILTYHSPLSNNLNNSYAQQQPQQTQQPSILTLSPWSNKQLHTICTHGMCSGTVPTANSANTQNNHSGNTRWHNNNIMNPFLSNSISDTKEVPLSHTFASNKVLGPDRFRFVTSYWTTPDTSNGVDVGTSANNTYLAANSLPPNPELEVDTNEGYSSLAVAIQYQGVVKLAGITAALKLPIGFKAINPLTSD